MNAYYSRNEVKVDPPDFGESKTVFTYRQMNARVTFSLSINWSSGGRYSSSLLTANVVARRVSAPSPPPPPSSSATTLSSHPNRFLMESIRSTTRRPLDLSTDSLMAFCGDGGVSADGCGPTSIVRRGHVSVIGPPSGTSASRTRSPSFL